MSYTTGPRALDKLTFDLSLTFTLYIPLKKWDLYKKKACLRFTALGPGQALTLFNQINCTFKTLMFNAAQPKDLYRPK